MPSVDNRGVVDYSGMAVSATLEDNIAQFKDILGGMGTAKFRRVKNIHNNLDCCIVFLDGMTNGMLINDSVIRAAKNFRGQVERLDSLIEVCESEEESDIASLVDSVMYGDTLLFAEGYSHALVVNSKGFSARGVGEPDTEKALLGPREGFVEGLMANLSLLGKRLVTSDYKVDTMKIGTRTNTKVAICYLDSLVDASILEDVKARLEGVNTDGILDANYLIECIKDSPLSPFKTIGSTEKPDVAASRILEGRIIIVVDGSCMVITAPYTFEENFQSPDDYYLNFYYASCGRILRYVAFFLAFSLPAVYVALLTFHPEMIPSQIVHMLIATTNDVPFPTVVECLIMLVLFEILKETGMRASNKIGQSMGLLGGIVMGEAAVIAGIISAPMLIITAFAVMTGLLVPHLSTPILIFRFVSIIAAAIFGLIGFFVVFTVILVQICSLKSLGQWHASWEKGDGILRMPMWKMKGRPPYARDKVRR